MIKQLFALASMASVALACPINPAHATATYSYKNGEYLVVRDGYAPNKRFSIASHGDGKSGDGNFHLYLMAEPAHTKIAPLGDIGSDNTLDTAPDAYHATWSTNSRHVAVSFRSDRHVAETYLYSIHDRRTHLVGGPALFVAATRRQAGWLNEDMRKKYSDLTWSSPTRFVLKEHRVFVTTTPDLVRALGKFGKQVERYADKNASYIEFSAEAVCELSRGNRYRIVEIKPGRFDE